MKKLTYCRIEIMCITEDETQNARITTGSETIKTDLRICPIMMNNAFECPVDSAMVLNPQNGS
jgi:hypothetical protein